MISRQTFQRSSVIYSALRTSSLHTITITTITNAQHRRHFHASPGPSLRQKQQRQQPPSAAAARDGQQAPTSFSDLDVLGNTPVPSTSVDVCMYDGFGLNSGVSITDGDGALLVNGEAFRWRPWEVTGEKRLVNEKGQFEIPGESLGMFDMLWPRPDMLIIGVGKNIMPLSPKTKAAIAEMGMRVDVLDTRNAAAQFNLLATERGVGEVAAALIPIGWREGVGVE